MMREHGHFTIKVENSILLSYFFGAWNIEQTFAYSHQVKQHVQPLLNSPWTRIVDLSQWEGGGEEVVKPLQELQQWAEKNNCHQTIFINPPLIPKFMLEKYGDPYGDFKVFQSENEAKQWLKSTAYN